MTGVFTAQLFDGQFEGGKRCGIDRGPSDALD
jgi:hypothetical protein